MKKGLLFVTVLIVAATMGTAFAEGLGVDVSADFYSKYVWRGMLLNDDYAFQPGVSKTFGTDMGDVTLGIWGSMDMTSYTGQQGQFTEVDYYVDYTVTVAEGIDASVGYIYYDFPQTERDPGKGNTSEIYLGAAFDTFLSPSVTWYMDVDNFNGASYLSFAIGHTCEDLFELAPEVPVSLDLGANLGYGNSEYNTGYFGVTDGGMTDAGFSIALPFEVSGLSVTPSFNWTRIVDGDLRDKSGYSAEADQFFTGISLGMSF